MKATISRIALILCSVFTMGYSHAAAPEGDAGKNDRSAMERSLEQQLNRYLSFPVLERNTDMTGEVTVAFVIDAEGKVQVLECVSANEALRAYVLRKLARIDVGDNADGMWKTSYLRLRFKPEHAA
jgi:hypothetical protein